MLDPWGSRLLTQDGRARILMGGGQKGEPVSISENRCGLRILVPDSCLRMLQDGLPVPKGSPRQPASKKRQNAESHLDPKAAGKSEMGNFSVGSESASHIGFHWPPTGKSLQGWGWRLPAPPTSAPFLGAPSSAAAHSRP